jgi:hypothetical protein
LAISLWIPQLNSYNIIAYITDANDATLYHKVYNGTFVWYNTSAINPAASMFNVIKVADQELQIWTQYSAVGQPDSNIISHDMLIVNLTKAVNINVPLNLWPQAYQSSGNLSFTLPPLTFTFREINKNGYYDAASLSGMPSGWKYQPVSMMRTPAWVEEKVPTWLGPTAPLEVVGHIDWGYSQTYIAP